jgi:hypothetical protein
MERVRDILNDLIEELAAIEHERWSHWQQYLHDSGIRQPDGSIILPADLIARWDGQIAKKYLELSDNEKESDREQVRRYIPLILSALTGQR